MEGNHFDRLSSELITPIMLELPTTKDLYSLIRASPKAFQVFLASKETILVSLMHQVIRPAAFIDALAAVQASQLKDLGPDRRAVLLFVRKYENKRQKAFGQDGQHYSLATAIALCQLYRSTQYFIKDLTSRSNFYLRRCRETLTIQTPYGFDLAEDDGFGLQGSQGEHVVDRDDQYDPLSCEEESRLQRAFYRYELYTQIFGSNMEYMGEKLWELPLDSHFFLDNYQHWEIEELRCVDNYLWSRLSNTFDRIENSFIGIQLNELPLDLSLQYYLRSAKLREAKYQISSLYLDYLMNMSLPLLHHALRFDRLRMQQEMSSHIFYDSEKRSLSTRLEEYWRLLSRSDGIVVHDYALATSDHSQFKDTIDRPNEGWLYALSKRGSYRSSTLNTVQSLGYVFWDSQRLRKAEFVGPLLIDIDVRCRIKWIVLPSFTVNRTYDADNASG
ncbi:hypothetical protein BDR22DRAFT_817744 [Usnea florida]